MSQTLLIVIGAIVVLNELCSTTYQEQSRAFARSIPPLLLLLRFAVTVALYAVYVAAVVEAF